jgi:hypothetical protein
MKLELPVSVIPLPWEPEVSSPTIQEYVRNSITSQVDGQLRGVQDHGLRLVPGHFRVVIEYVK